MLAIITPIYRNENVDRAKQLALQAHFIESLGKWFRTWIPGIEVWIFRSVRSSWFPDRESQSFIYVLDPESINDRSPNKKYIHELNVSSGCDLLSHLPWLTYQAFSALMLFVGSLTSLGWEGFFFCATFPKKRACKLWISHSCCCFCWSDWVEVIVTIDPLGYD